MLMDLILISLRPFRVSPAYPDSLVTAPDSAGLWEIRSDGSDLHPVLAGWHNRPANPVASGRN